jgi:hypothetical protein
MSAAREAAAREREGGAGAPRDSHCVKPALALSTSLLPPVYLSKKLTQPLPTKGGAVLRTIGEAANYILALPHDRAEHCNRWRHAARLLLDQADVADLSRQVHLALFYEQCGSYLPPRSAAASRDGCSSRLVSPVLSPARISVSSSLLERASAGLSVSTTSQVGRTSCNRISA